MKYRWPIGLTVGLLVVLMPPVGLPCLWIYCIRDRQARRGASLSVGEVSRSVSRALSATGVAPAEPRRPRDTEDWTRPEDYAR